MANYRPIDFPNGMKNIKEKNMKKKNIITYVVTLVGFITIGVLCSIPLYNVTDMQVEAETTALNYFDNLNEDIDYDDLDLVNTDLILEKSLKGYLGLGDTYKMKYDFVYGDWHCDFTVLHYDEIAQTHRYYVSDVSWYPGLKK